MTDEPVTTYGALITYLQTKLGNGYEVLPKYPDREPDKTKRIIIVALVRWDGEVVAGDAGSGSTPYTDTSVAFRVEAWANDSDGTPAQAKSLQDIATVRRMWTRAPQDVLTSVGLQPLGTSSPIPIDFDGAYPGWMRSAIWLNAHKDETA